MSVFVISDLHLSFGVDKPMDVFGARWENFENRLLENWHACIGENDTVVVPGDLSWGLTLEEARPDFAFLDALPGKKLLLKGNHDYYWNTLTKLSSFLKENHFNSLSFLHNNACFADGLILCGSRGWLCESSLSETDQKILARETLRFSLSCEQGERLRKEHPEAEMVVFSHYPIAVGSCRNPVLDVLVEHQVKRVYYGHLHMITDSSKLLQEEAGVSFHLVSADFLEFNPLKIDS